MPEDLLFKPLGTVGLEYLCGIESFFRPPAELTHSRTAQHSGLPKGSNVVPFGLGIGDSSMLPQKGTT